MVVVPQKYVYGVIIFYSPTCAASTPGEIVQERVVYSYGTSGCRVKTIAWGHVSGDVYTSDGDSSIA